MNYEMEQRITIECYLVFIIEDLRRRIEDMSNRVDEIMKTIEFLKTEQPS
jgi:hypothetical protein